MTQKTISLPEELYEKLKARKRDDENFPQLIDRLLQEEEGNEKVPISLFFGKFEESFEGEGEEIEKKILQGRLLPNTRKSIKFDE